MGTEYCLFCDSGYKSEEGAEECHLCQEGYYWGLAVRNNVPRQAFISPTSGGVGSKQRGDKKAENATRDGYACVKCPPNALCPEGLVPGDFFQPVAKDGFWRDEAAAEDDPLQVPPLLNLFQKHLRHPPREPLTATGQCERKKSSPTTPLALRFAFFCPGAIHLQVP